MVCFTQRKSLKLCEATQNKPSIACRGRLDIYGNSVRVSEGGRKNRDIILASAYDFPVWEQVKLRDN